MKITIIYDNMEKDTTYSSVQILVNKIKSYTNVYVKEFFVPTDLPYSCCNCYSCFNTDINCLYLDAINKLSNSLIKSDLIILASSLVSNKISPQMNNMLENLSYKWLPHKANGIMQNKIAVAITTSPLFSLPYGNTTLLRNLRFWGINKHSIFSKSLSNNNIENMSTYKIIKLDSTLSYLTFKILNKYERFSNVITPDFSRSCPLY